MGDKSKNQAFLFLREVSEIKEKDFKIVPVKKEEIEHRKVTLSKKDSRKYLEIGSLDDLARIKEKIKIKKESLRL